MVLLQHKTFYDSLFKIEGFWKSPFLMFGFQDLDKKFDPFIQATSFKEYLLKRGMLEVLTLDYADDRADVHFDMNNSITDINNFSKGLFSVVCDIGCLEHVFNTAQCLANCMYLVEVGGLYILHTPVSGYHKHGLHTFNPEMLVWVFEQNGFEIIYKKYSTKGGNELPELLPYGDTLIWLVGRRVKEMNEFVIPIQDRNYPFHPSKLIK